MELEWQKKNASEVTSKGNESDNGALLFAGKMKKTWISLESGGVWWGLREVER